jgi:hypothetical protein
MKKVIKPAEKEEAVYFSDISGKSFGEFGVPVELKLSFNYGSKYDGTEITFQMDDNDVKPVLDLLKELVTSDFKEASKKFLENHEKSLEDSIQMRDWEYCDRMSDNIQFWRDFLKLKTDNKKSTI